MSNEESPEEQLTRRTTRSSILASACTQPKKLQITHKPTIRDLIHIDKPITLDNLLSTFPGRASQISEILRHLGPLNSPMFPLFINGGASTGKTSTVLQVFRHLRRPFVYTSCITCHSPRILFESILNQLLLHMRTSENSYSNAKRCEKPSDFASFLRDTLVNVLDNLKMLGSVKSGNMIYLIIDNVELVREWDKSSRILPFLFGLSEMLKLPEVGVIFISRSSLDTFHPVLPDPVSVYFPHYNEKELRAILLLQQKQENFDLYSCFLDTVLMSFCRVNRRVDILSTDLSPLFTKYCEPLGGDVNMGDTKQQREETKRKLYDHIRPHILTYLNSTFKVHSSRASAAAAGMNRSKGNNNNNSRKSEVGNEIAELEFHMSTSAKYLLMSAFIASRNPATLDASLFDSTGGLDNRKKRRKCSGTNVEQKEKTAEEELVLKGPGTFPLERLLAIYQCISIDGVNYDEDGDDDGNKNELMCDVLLQISSLCNANFISKGGSCPLECSTRYRCAISEELALKVARSLKFPLSKYLYRR